MVFFLAFVISASPVPDIVTFRRPMVSQADAVRLLGAHPPRGSAGARSVLRLNGSGQARLVSSVALATLAGLPSRPDRRIFALSYRPGHRQLPCLATARSMARQSVLYAQDVVPAPCDHAAAGLFAYDRGAKAIVAMAAIPSHVRIGLWLVAPRPSVSRGEVIALRSSVGLAVVERQVTALQAGDPGQTVFVRGITGPAFALPVFAEAR